MAKPGSLDLKLYPTTYESPAGGKIAFVIGHISIILVATFAKTHVSILSVFPSWAFWTLLACYGLVGTAFVLVAFTRVTLYTDRIESKNLLGKQILCRDKIAGWIIRPTDGALILESKDFGESFLIPIEIKKDAAWDDWMSGIPPYKP